MEDQTKEVEPEQELEELCLLIDSYVYWTVSADGPDWYACPIYKQTFGNQKEYDANCEEMPLEFAPGLLDILKAPQPPPAAVFATTPEVPKSTLLWGVYSLLMECPGKPPMLYVGSGTDSWYSIRARTRT